MKCRAKDCFQCPYPDCINDFVPKSRKNSPETIAKRIQKKSALIKERQSLGLCTSCGKEKPRDGYKMCFLCRYKARKYKESESRKNGLTPRFMMDGIHLCQKCGKSAPVHPYKLCSRCLESNRRHLDKTPTHNGKRQVGLFCESNEIYWH